MRRILQKAASQLCDDEISNSGLDQQPEPNTISGIKDAAIYSWKVQKQFSPRGRREGTEEGGRRRTCKASSGGQLVSQVAETCIENQVKRGTNGSMEGWEEKKKCRFQSSAENFPKTRSPQTPSHSSFPAGAGNFFGRFGGSARNSKAQAILNFMSFIIFLQV